MIWRPHQILTPPTDEEIATMEPQDLIDLHKKKKEIKKDEAGKGPDVVNNNLFVGSTAEMLKMIKDNQHNDG